MLHESTRSRLKQLGSLYSGTDGETGQSDKWRGGLIVPPIGTGSLRAITRPTSKREAWRRNSASVMAVCCCK